jgi:3-hydroxybutyryl-CoA dehydratase
MFLAHTLRTLFPGLSYTFRILVDAATAQGGVTTNPQVMTTEIVQLNAQHEFIKTFSAEEVTAFANLSQDDNPIHVDDDYARQSIFKQRVVHGVLIVSMFSKIFGTIYPGNGGIYMSQTAKFVRPAFIGDELTARVTLVEFDDEKKRGRFLCEAFNSKAELLLTGEAKILFPKHFSIA